MPRNTSVTIGDHFSQFITRHLVVPLIKKQGVAEWKINMAMASYRGIEAASLSAPASILFRTFGSKIDHWKRREISTSKIALCNGVPAGVTSHSWSIGTT